MGTLRPLLWIGLASISAGVCAQSATVTLTNRNQTVARPLSGTTDVVYNGVVTTTGGYNGATMILFYAYRAWAYSSRPEYTYSPQLIAWLSDLGVKTNGGTYSGPLFTQHVTSTLPGGYYHHSAAGINAPAICYLKFDGQFASWETNRDSYTLAITGAEKQVEIDLNDPTYPDNQWFGEFTVQMYSGNTLLATEQAYAESDGRLRVDRMLPDGPVRFRVQGGHWLAKETTLNLSNGYSWGNTLTLTNGDIDGDNEVSILDYIYLSTNFGLTFEDPGYYDEDSSGISPAECDLDADAEVSILDYIILSSSYGLTGD